MERLNGFDQTISHHRSQCLFIKLESKTFATKAGKNERRGRKGGGMSSILLGCDVHYML